MVDLDRCLEIAKSAAILAGEFILKSQDSDLEVLLSTGRDLKLQLDIDAENTIKKYLTLYSSYAILGEETGLSNKLNEVYWVIDPLDGTSNFLRKIPISCVSIALMNEKKPILGVIYDFNHNEIFFGHINRPSIQLISAKAVEKTLNVIREQGITTVIVEQNAVRALELADRSVILDTGGVVFDGTAKEVLDNSELRAEYLAI